MAANSPPTVYGEPSATVAVQESTEQRNEQNVLTQQVVPLTRGRSRECDPGRSETIRENAISATDAPKSIVHGPYGQMVASQVDETVPSSYQKSPKLIHRARASLQQRPSSLPVMPIVDQVAGHAETLCTRIRLASDKNQQAHMTPSSSMMVTPESLPVNPPASPTMPIASASSHIDEGSDVMVDAQIKDIKEKELRSKLRSKRNQLEAMRKGGRKSQNSSNSCGSRDRSAQRRRIENVRRLGASVQDLSPSSRMQLSNADANSVVDSGIDVEDWVKAIHSSGPEGDVHGNHPLASQSLSEGVAGAIGSTPPPPTVDDMQVEGQGHFGPGVVQSMTPPKVLWRSAGGNAVQGGTPLGAQQTTSNTQNIQVLNATNAQPSAETVAAVEQAMSARAAEIRAQTVTVCSAEAENLHQQEMQKVAAANANQRQFII